MSMVSPDTEQNLLDFIDQTREDAKRDFTKMLDLVYKVSDVMDDLDDYDRRRLLSEIRRGLVSNSSRVSGSYVSSRVMFTMGDYGVFMDELYLKALADRVTVISQARTSDSGFPLEPGSPIR